MLLQNPQMIWVYPSDHVGAFRVSVLGVESIDEILRKIPGLLAAAALVIVAEYVGPYRDENGPLVKLVTALRVFVWAELGNFER